MATAQAEKQSDVIQLISGYANHRIIEKEMGRDDKYRTILDLKFRNGVCIKTRKEFEALKKIPVFMERLGKSFYLFGATNINPGRVPIPDVVQGTDDNKQDATEIGTETQGE